MGGRQEQEKEPEMERKGRKEKGRQEQEKEPEIQRKGRKEKGRMEKEKETEIQIKGRKGKGRKEKGRKEKGRKIEIKGKIVVKRIKAEIIKEWTTPPTTSFGVLIFL